MTTKNSLATGRRGARYTKYETYTNNKAAWSKMWNGFCNCEVKTLPPHGCKVLADTRCPIHRHATLIPNKIDFSQDGRPRLRANLPVPGEKVQITGRAKGKMRTKQQNQRILLCTYNFLRNHPDFVPHPKDIDPVTGEKYEYSHLCLRPDCFEGTHITYETRAQNRDRERCFVDTCHRRAEMGLKPHVPACIMSSTDVMQTSADVKWYRQRVFPNWQKRGKKKKKEAMSSGESDDDDDSPNNRQRMGSSSSTAVSSAPSVPAHPPTSVSSGVPASR